MSTKKKKMYAFFWWNYFCRQLEILIETKDGDYWDSTGNLDATEPGLSCNEDYGSFTSFNKKEVVFFARGFEQACAFIKEAT